MILRLNNAEICTKTLFNSSMKLKRLVCSFSHVIKFQNMKNFRKLRKKMETKERPNLIKKNSRYHNWGEASC